MTPEQKKEYKKALLKKNRQHQRLFLHVRVLRQDQERIAREMEERKPKREEKREETPVWSAKVASIRNRLTGQQRESKDRWNRFAGTSGGGGRGL